MSITRNILYNLYEDDKLDADVLAKNLFDEYYDKEQGKFTKDLSQDIAKICNNDQHYIYQVKQELNKLVDEVSSETKEEVNLSPELKETGDKISKILNN